MLCMRQLTEIMLPKRKKKKKENKRKKKYQGIKEKMN